MTTPRRSTGPTWYGERRIMDVGIAAVIITFRKLEGSAYLVGGGAEGAARPLVPELCAVANRALRSAEDCATLEVHGSAVLAVHGGVVGLAVDDQGPGTIVSGSQMVVRSALGARVCYVAVGGGIDMASASGPGWEVNVRTSLRPGWRRGVNTIIPPHIDLGFGEPIRLRGDAARVAALGEAAFTVASGGRTAVVLDGPAVRAPGGGAGEAPVGFGAVMLTPEGKVVVAGPDHAALAPAPVVAQVIDADLGRLFARRDGAAVRFVAA
jgi:hypothetical protein